MWNREPELAVDRSCLRPARVRVGIRIPFQHEAPVFSSENSMDERPIRHRALIANDVPGCVAICRAHHHEVPSGETWLHARAADDEVLDGAPESLRREQEPRGKRRRQGGAHRDHLAQAERHHRIRDR